MRTTVTIDDDVLAAAQTLAREERLSVGAMLSRLARAGLRPEPEAADQTGIPRFSVSGSARPFGPDDVAAALEEW